MAAKRLGAALTNITGVAGQVLKVKGDESGFEFATPATIPAYTVTNKTVDRVINADDVTLDEVADVLATLIDDLAATGAPGGVQGVYTSGTYSHTASGGGTMYTITHNLGSEPDYVMCQQLDTSGRWVNMVSVFNDPSGNSYGFNAYLDNNTDINVSKFYVYKFIDGVPSATIRFICAKLGSTSGISAFTWSTSEQVWPFEKDRNGNTIYCKEVDLGALPNATYKRVSHSIPDLVMANVRKLEGMWYLNGSQSISFNNAADGIIQGVTVNLYVDDQYDAITVVCTTNLSSYTGFARIWYIK